MMKKRSIAVLALGLCLALSACQPKTELPTPAPVPTPTVQVKPTPTAQIAYTAEDAYKAFAAHNEKNKITGQTPTQCALAEDNDGGLMAVILYTDEEKNNECWMSFVYAAGTPQIVGFAANENDDTRDFRIVAGSTLTYEGKSTVSISAQEEKTGNIYKFTLRAEASGSDVSFTLTSETQTGEQ